MAGVILVDIDNEGDLLQIERESSLVSINSSCWCWNWKQQRHKSVREDHASMVEGEAVPFCQRTTERIVSTCLHTTIHLPECCRPRMLDKVTHYSHLINLFSVNARPLMSLNNHSWPPIASINKITETAQGGSDIHVDKPGNTTTIHMSEGIRCLDTGIHLTHHNSYTV